VPKMYPSDRSIKDSVVRNMLAGFRYIGRNKILLQLMIYSVVVALLAMPFRMLVPAYAKDVYGSAGSSVGILLTATGLGALIGSVAIANLREGHHRGWILIGGALIAGLSLALISGFPVFLAGVIAMVGTGIGEQARWALGQSVMMENSADEFRSRVMSVLMMTYGLMPLGMYPLGWSMEQFGGQQAVGMIAFLLIGFGVLSVFLLPNLRRIK
ncbi:MAG: MFS transporter, partial [Chloroflexota bacterium]|nr:MFS transporter [Chloroflexota bacterium]